MANDAALDLPGVLYVSTEDDLDLPVIDVTHPAFALGLSPEDLDAAHEQQVQQMRSQPEVTPQILERFHGSVIGRALVASAGGVLGAIPTYYLKVGLQGICASAHPIDRAIAGSPAATLVRQRLQDMARLLADGLKPRLVEQPDANILLTCLAGGAAAETWNTLLYLKQESAPLIAARAVAVRVLDMDASAPEFGGKAMSALCEAGNPLGEIPVSWEYHPYDWAKAEELAAYLEAWEARKLVCAVSSEGGLFEYGSDEEIVANLKAIDAGTGPGTVVVGSVTRDCESVRRTLERGGMALRPRALEEFRGLADGAGWELDAVLERPGTFNVRLGKRPS